MLFNGVINQRGVPMVIGCDLADRPAAGVRGRIWFRWDAPYGIYEDTGTTWQQISAAGGTVPSLQQVCNVGSVTNTGAQFGSTVTVLDSGTGNAVQLGASPGDIDLTGGVYAGTELVGPRMRIFNGSSNGYYGRNAANTANIPMMQMTAGNQIAIDPNGQGIVLPGNSGTYVTGQGQYRSLMPVSGFTPTMTNQTNIVAHSFDLWQFIECQGVVTYGGWVSGTTLIGATNASIEFDTPYTPYFTLPFQSPYNVSGVAFSLADGSESITGRMSAVSTETNMRLDFNTNTTGVFNFSITGTFFMPS